MEVGVGVRVGVGVGVRVLGHLGNCRPTHDLHTILGETSEKSALGFGTFKRRVGSSCYTVHVVRWTCGTATNKAHEGNDVPATNIFCRAAYGSKRDALRCCFYQFCEHVPTVPSCSLADCWVWRRVTCGPKLSHHTRLHNTLPNKRPCLM